MNRDAGLAVMKALKRLAAQDSARSINELRIVVALERAIARIENVPELSSHVVFKGGFVLFKWIESKRFTRDVDALVFEFSKEKISTLMEKALAADLADGVWYGDVKTAPLEHQAGYEGIRFSVAFQIGGGAAVK